MIREADVNMAMVQQAAEELEIGVPIRSWRVEEGELVLSLAYGGEARWSDRTDDGRWTKDGAPWEFLEAQRDKEPRYIPDGDLSKLTKRELRLIALSWGYRTDTLRVLKAEFVEAVVWARENLQSLLVE